MPPSHTHRPSSDRTLLHALTRDRTASPLVRWLARVVSLYERAPPRELVDEALFFLDAVPVWLARRVILTMAGRVRRDRLRAEARAPDHSGWPGTAVWLLAWAAVVAAVAHLLL